MEHRISWPARAIVRPIEDETEYNLVLSCLAQAAESEVLALTEAAPSPIVDGRPRMLHITAFIVHEGTNSNGQAFVGEELEQIVANGLFQPPYAGMIDFNHDFEPRGFWYNSKYVFDPEADRMGILAEGAVWAWKFPMLADLVLAEQTRRGSVAVSISALSKYEQLELTQDENGRVIQIVHNPVFIAASLLDVPPGDMHARGISRDDGATAEHEDTPNELHAAALQSEETIPMDEIKAILSEALSGLDLDGKFDQVVASLTEKVESVSASLQAELAARDTTVAELTAKLEAAEARVAELETTLAEKDVLVESLNADKETLASELEAVKAENDAFRAEKEQIEIQARLHARMEQLPVTFRTRFEERPAEVRERLMQTWASLSDDEWETRLAEITLGAVTETRLPAMGASPAGHVDIAQYLR